MPMSTMTASLSFSQSGAVAGAKPCDLAPGDFAMLLPGLMAVPAAGDDARQAMAVGGKILPVPLPDSDAADGEEDAATEAPTDQPLGDDPMDDRLLADAALMLALPGWPVPVAADPAAVDVAADASALPKGDDPVSGNPVAPVAAPVADDGPASPPLERSAAFDKPSSDGRMGVVPPRLADSDIEVADRVFTKAAAADGKGQVALTGADVRRIVAASTDGHAAVMSAAPADRLATAAGASPVPAPFDTKDGAATVLKRADGMALSPRISLKTDTAAASPPAPRAVAPDPVADSIARPAGQVFAARIVAALDAPAPSASRRPADDHVAAPLAVLPGSVQTDLTARPVSAPAAADQPPLNTRDADWIEKLVDRIDMMRTDSGSRETRIRLSPDALGTLDVRIEDKDGQVRVHFSADHAATRALIADAAPRLADLAEARGLKLTQGFADSQGQSAARQDQSQQHRPAARPASVFDTGGDVAAGTGQDGRIA